MELKQVSGTIIGYKMAAQKTLHHCALDWQRESKDVSNKN